MYVRVLRFTTTSEHGANAAPALFFNSRRLSLPIEQHRGLLREKNKEFSETPDDSSSVLAHDFSFATCRRRRRRATTPPRPARRHFPIARGPAYLSTNTPRNTLEKIHCWSYKDVTRRPCVNRIDLACLVASRDALSSSLLFV